MKKLAIVILAFVVLNNPNLKSQTDEKRQLPLIGFGLHIEQFKLNDIGDLSQSPVNKIILTLNPTQFIRIEPEFGFRYSKADKTDLKSSTISFGLGGFGMIQKNDLNIYGGLRFEYNLYSREDLLSMNQNKETNKYSRVMIGPALGGEYFFGKNFSIGGEVSILYVSLVRTIDPKPTGYEDVKSNYSSTNTGLFLRIYF